MLYCVILAQKEKGKRDMSTILGIFQQLELDLSLFYQLFIIFILFLLSNMLFIQKLKSVLIYREDQTVNLSKKALEKLQVAQDISSQFNTQMRKAQDQIIEKYRKLKDEWVLKEELSFKEKQEEGNKKYNQLKIDLKKEIHGYQENVFKEKDELSKLLLEKWMQ